MFFCLNGHCQINAARDVPAMTKPKTVPSGRETSFHEDEIIVSKTDPTGRITYANQVFMRVSGYDERELIGAPHSLIRHPAMPRSVFRLLWQTIGAGREIFAYVNNMAKNGDNYWVFAHVTPSFDLGGALVGYHSNRRLPDRSAIEKVAPLYAALLEIENKPDNRKNGLEAATEHLVGLLKSRGLEYDEFVFSL